MYVDTLYNVVSPRRTDPSRPSPRAYFNINK